MLNAPVAPALERIDGLTAATMRVVPGCGAVGDRGLVRNQRNCVPNLLAAVRETRACGLST